MPEDAISTTAAATASTATVWARPTLVTLSLAATLNSSGSGDDSVNVSTMQSLL